MQHSSTARPLRAHDQHGIQVELQHPKRNRTAYRTEDGSIRHFVLFVSTEADSEWASPRPLCRSMYRAVHGCGSGCDGNGCC